VCICKMRIVFRNNQLFLDVRVFTCVLLCVSKKSTQREQANYSSDSKLTNKPLFFFIHAFVRVYSCVYWEINPKRAYLFFGISTFACVLLCMVNDPKRAGNYSSDIAILTDKCCCLPVIFLYACICMHIRE
jgi:hypothetical protein